MRRARRLAHSAAAGALLLGAVGCGTDEDATGMKAPPVMVARVDTRTITDRIEATGQLLAVAEAAVAAEVSGRVTEVLVLEGAPVAAGDVVLEIDRERRELGLESERALVAEATEAIAEAKREVERVRTLHARQAVSKAQLDDAETKLRRAGSRLQAARAQRGLAERALRDATVTAPFEGLVARRYVSAGDYVSEGQKLYDLVALDPIEVEFHLTERDSGRVHLGDEVAVRVASQPDEVFSALVNVVSPRIDSSTRTLRVKAQLDNAEARLRPGLFARADLGVATRDDVPMLPEDAILRRSDGSVVYVLVDGNRVERRNVRTGVYREGYVEATSGVTAGEHVVVRGQARLVDGSVVDVRTADGAPVTPGAMAGAPDTP